MACRRIAAKTAVFLLAATFLPLAEAADDDPLVLVETVVDARYGKSPLADESFAAMLESPLEVLYTVKRGENLQGIASKLFGIGPTSAGAEYRKLEQRVLAINPKVESADKLQAGAKIRFPDLVPIQSKEPVGGNPYYLQPRISPGPRLAQVRDGSAYDATSKAYTVMPSLTETGSKAAPEVVKWRWVRASVARELIENSGGGVRRTQWSGPMKIRFAQSGPGATSSSVQADTSYVKVLLARRKPTSQALLFILDDSFPSQAEFLATRDVLRDAVAAVRAKFTLGNPEWDPAVLQKGAATDFPFVAAGRGGHAANIAMSLQSFTSLTASVKVVYLPLFLEQKLAREVWRELILVTQLAAGKGAALGTPYLPLPETRKAAIKNTDDILSTLPGQVQAGVADADQALVTALLKFAQLHAIATGTPFFLSMSWTVLTNSMDLTPIADMAGLPIAAAGNDPKEDVVALKTLFSYRAKEFPGDVLAVMNPEADGSLTCSSQWTVPQGEVFYGLAYEGRLSPNLCGTSFSTPRVAWLLALRESYNGPITAANIGSWFSDYRKFLIAQQDGGQPGFLRYRLAPQRLFSGL